MALLHGLECTEQVLNFIMQLKCLPRTPEDVFEGTVQREPRGSARNELAKRTTDCPPKETPALIIKQLAEAPMHGQHGPGGQATTLHRLLRLRMQCTRFPLKRP